MQAGSFRPRSINVNWGRACRETIGNEVATPRDCYRESPHLFSKANELVSNNSDLIPNWLERMISSTGS